METRTSKAERFIKKAKELLRSQKQALIRARDRIRLQDEEIEFLKALLARRLGFDRDRNMVVEERSVEVESPQVDMDMVMALGKPGAQA